jgi:hypothetical protein
MPPILYGFISVAALGLPLLAFLRFRWATMLGLFAGFVLVLVVRWLAPIALAHAFQPDQADGTLYDFVSGVTGLLCSNFVFFFYSGGNILFAGLMLAFFTTENSAKEKVA